MKKKIIITIIFIVSVLSIVFGFLFINKDSSKKNPPDKTPKDPLSARYEKDNSYIQLIRLNDKQVLVLAKDQAITLGYDIGVVTEYQNEKEIVIGPKEDQTTILIEKGKVIANNEEYVKTKDYNIDNYYYDTVSKEENTSYNNIYKKDNILLKTRLISGSYIEIRIENNNQIIIENIYIDENGKSNELIDNKKIIASFDENTFTFQYLENDIVNNTLSGTYQKVSDYSNAEIIIDRITNPTGVRKE